jgi:hypothetical protein
MTPHPTPQPPSTDNLIQITVTVNPTGPPAYTALYYFNGAHADPAKLRTADSVSWIVKLAVGGELRPVPFSLKFHDPSIFGLSKLSVPHGGFSDPLRAVSLGGSTKYDILLPDTRIAIDPEIQVDNTDMVGVFVKSNSRFVILWDPPNNAVSFKKDEGGFQPFPSPLNISFGDTVRFEAVTHLTSGFVVDFPLELNPNHIWKSPFVQDQYEFAGHPGPSGYQVTDDLTAPRITDENRDFVFIARLGGEESDAFTIEVAKPKEPSGA